MINAGIIGASGYTGGELMRLLLNHPEVNIVAATSRNLEGKSVSDHHRHLKGFLDLEFQDLGPEDIKASCNVAFLAAPHGAAMGLVSGLLEGKLKGAAG
jgi:N-acetyl-gamma-glutamyl-phosphate reductase